jgi:hypothetical protein
MDDLNWTTRWEVWRDLVGTPSSARRQQVNRFLETRPCLLYWGDSWFSTPLYMNLAKQSMSRIDGMAVVVGKPGATASKLFSAGEIREISGRLKGSPFDVVCLSAGGNDELSERLEKIFAAWVPPKRARKISPEAAFQILLDSKTLQGVQNRYRAVLGAFEPLVSKRPAFRVVGHSYAPLVRIGAKADLNPTNIGLIAWLKGSVGPWLWPVMQHVLADKASGKVFADLLLKDGFREMVLVPLTVPGEFGSFFSVADFEHTPGVDQDAFWNDEIHPTQEGFAKMARIFNRQIRDHLPFPKQGAIS